MSSAAYTTQPASPSPLRPIRVVLIQPEGYAHAGALSELVETNELAQGGIEEAQAVGQGHPVQHLDARALAARRHQTGKVAEGIIGEACGQSLEGRKVIGAGDMGQMMLHAHTRMTVILPLPCA